MLCYWMLISWPLKENAKDAKGARDAKGRRTEGRGE
jgi:hypothetical protein